MATKGTDIPGAERAATLLMSLGEQDAASILHHLDPRDVEAIGVAMAKLPAVSMERAEVVLESFLTRAASGEAFGGDSRGYMKSILVSAFGAPRAEVMLDRIFSGSTGGSSVDALGAMDPRIIVQLIGEEHPQIIAALVAQLDGKVAAKVLAQLPEAFRADLLVRIATLEDLPQAALSELDRLVADRIASGPRSESRKIGGTCTVADIVNAMERDSSDTVLGEIEGRDAELHAEIRDLLFVFDDLVGIDDKAIQAILREVSGGILATALRGASPPVTAKIYGNMSKRAAEILKEDIEALGRTRLSEVEAAQREMLNVVQKLAADGVIVIGSDAAEYV
jgi:flagellar motor switch protein FliG